MKALAQGDPAFTSHPEARPEKITRKMKDVHHEDCSQYLVENKERLKKRC
jgi:hypothetical protein